MSERRVRADQLPKGAGTAAEVVAVPSASVILLRGRPFEVLLMRRNERSSFVPGAWVFPGGTLDDGDARDGEDEERALRRCAVREVFEETGIWLGDRLDEASRLRERLLGGEPLPRDLDANLEGALDDLVLTARWITPVGVPKRFDTSFYLAQVNDGVDGTPDDGEGLELIWITPGDALRRHQEDDLPMVFPTIKNLEALAEYDDPQQLLADRWQTNVRTILPILVIEDGQKKIIIPDEE